MPSAEFANSSPRYVVANGWTHIFSEGRREVERITRWAFDRQKGRLVRLHIQRNHKWRESRRSELLDVEDSIMNANPDTLIDPEGWDLAESDDLPAWD